jgi:1,2-diacylglycerol 3-alpha-glucosyltransferase
MKIGLFTDFYFPHVGGITTSVANARKGLEELGHEVYIFTTSTDDPSDKNIILLPTLPIKWDGVSLVHPFARVSKVIEPYNLDIIHIHTEGPTGVIGLFAARIYDLPFCHTQHTFLPGYLDSYKYPKTQLISMLLVTKFVFAINRQKLKKTEKFKLKETDFETKLAWGAMLASCSQYQLNIVPSVHLADKMKAAGFTGQLEVVPNGVDIDLYEMYYETPDDTVKIVSTARLSAEKSLDRLIKSASHIKTDKDWRIIIVGDGPERSTLEELAKNLRVADRIDFVGEKSQKEVIEILNNSNIFVLTSSGFDNQPMSILEATAAGLPVVYCDPDLKEALSDSNSLLSTTRGEDLASVFSQLIDNNDKRKLMSQASRRVALEYSNNKHAKRLLDIYSKTIKMKAQK